MRGVNEEERFNFFAAAAAVFNENLNESFSINPN